MFVILLILLIILQSSNGFNIKSRYHKYPDNIKPSLLNSNGFYRLQKASSFLKPEILSLSKEKLLQRYEFNDRFFGFVFVGGSLEEVLVSIGSEDDSFDFNLGELIKVSDSDGTVEFYEHVPLFKHEDVFIDKFFRFESNEFTKIGDCFIEKSDIGTGSGSREELETACTEIPRCSGYVVDECLLSSTSINTEPVEQSNKVFLKDTQHKVIKFISKPLGITLVSLTCIFTVAIQLISPRLMLLKRFNKNTNGYEKIDNNKF